MSDRELLALALGILATGATVDGSAAILGLQGKCMLYPKGVIEQLVESLNTALQPPTTPA